MMNLPKKQYTRLLMMILLGLVFFHAGRLQAQNTETVQALGTGQVVGQGLEKGREMAVANALVSAVAKVANDLLPEDGLVRYFPELNQSVFSTTESHVLDYKVLAEWNAGDTYRVLVEATVSVDSVKSRLSNAGYIRAQTDLPEVLFMVYEQKTSDTAPLYWWAWGAQPRINFVTEKLMQVMGESGFGVVNQESVTIPGELAELRQIPALSDKEACLLAGNSGARVIVSGYARVEASNLMGDQKRTFKGVLEVRAIQPESGRQIAKSLQSAVVSQSDEILGNQEVLTRLAEQAAKDLSDQISNVWSRVSVSQSQLTVTVQGTHNLSAFVRFRESLRTLNGVKEIFITEMKADEATIMVNYQGNAKALAEALMLNTYEGFSIHIFDIQENRVQIKLVQ
jgi:hypothetical protein